MPLNILCHLSLMNKSLTLPVQLLLFLFMFQSLAFCPASLMEAVAEKVIANPDVLTRKDLLCVLKVYSSLNYDLQDRRQQYGQSAATHFTCVCCDA